MVSGRIFLSSRRALPSHHRVYKIGMSSLIGLLTLFILCASLKGHVMPAFARRLCVPSSTNGY